jgi:hypothetical protein
MAEFKNGVYVAPSGKIYYENEQKKKAQQYAQAALNGTGGKYLPASQTANAVINAQLPLAVTDSRKNSKNSTASKNSSADSVYNAYSAAIDRQNRLLKQQRDLAESQRRASMEATVNTNNQLAEDSLKEAYIANMLAKRNLPQQLKAMGISGGASETTLADIENTYMNNRFAIEDGRNNANQKARLAYDNGVAGDYADYLTKAYNLQTTLAGKLASAGSTSAKKATDTNKSALQAVQGYRIGNNQTVHTSADSLLRELYNMGFTQTQAREYLKNAGLM